MISGVAAGWTGHPSFSRGRFSNSRKSVEKGLGGGGEVKVFCVLLTTTKTMKHCVSLHGNMEEIPWQKGHCLHPSKLLKGVVVKISSEGRGPKPPYLLVHPSLFCLVTPLVIIQGPCRICQTHVEKPPVLALLSTDSFADFFPLLL